MSIIHNSYVTYAHARNLKCLNKKVHKCKWCDQSIDWSVSKRQAAGTNLPLNYDGSVHTCAVSNGNGNSTTTQANNSNNNNPELRPAALIKT
jgi:hypothetical protein